MKYKENFVLTINFINLLNTRRDEGTKKKSNRIERNKITILSDEF